MLYNRNIIMKNVLLIKIVSAGWLSNSLNFHTFGNLQKFKFIPTLVSTLLLTVLLYKTFLFYQKTWLSYCQTRSLFYSMRNSKCMCLLYVASFGCLWNFIIVKKFFEKDVPREFECFPWNYKSPSLSYPYIKIY